MIVPAYLTGAAVTRFGRQPGRSAVDWQAAAALAAVADADVGLDEVDTVITGYATTSGHLMPADLLAERLGIRPRMAFGMSVGGATGLAMIAQAVHLVRSGAARTVLVAAGEDRASGQSRETSTQVLAQVGHAEYEVPLGGTVPAYYALLASRYLWNHGLEAGANAPIAVQMRAHAVGTEGAHLRGRTTVEDVLASRPIADPLRLLDCCPVSDGGAAFVVSATRGERAVEVLGTGQAHRHQHLCTLDPQDTGAGRAGRAALAEAGLEPTGIDVFGIYDSFTITFAMIVEELGLVPAGRAGAEATAFAVDGRYPTNTHGGLLSYGHCGVAGGLAHLAEVVAQLRGERAGAQVPGAATGYVHGDGGVMSAHVALALGRPR